VFRRLFAICISALFFISCGTQDGAVLPVPFDIFDEETHEYALLASIEESEIYLVGGISRGMTLHYGSRRIALDMYSGAGVRGIVPQIMHCRNGQDIIAIITHVGAGTGVSLSDLHVLGFDEDGEYALHTLYSTRVHSWLVEPMYATLAPNGQHFIFEFAGHTHEVNIFDDDYSGEFTGISFGDIVSFDFIDSKIITHIAVGADYDNHATPAFFGHIVATVLFDDGIFVLDDFGFVLYE